MIEINFFSKDIDNHNLNQQFKGQQTISSWLLFRDAQYYFSFRFARSKCSSNNQANQKKSHLVQRYVDWIIGSLDYLLGKQGCPARVSTTSVEHMGFKRGLALVIRPGFQSAPVPLCLTRHRAHVDLRNKFDYNSILFTNDQSNQLKMKPIIEKR